MWMLSPRAEDDLESLASDEQINAIVDEFEALARSPTLGRPRDEIRPGLRSRQIEFPPRTLYYTIQENDVVILRILFHGQDPEAQVFEI